jgi:membrane-associated phospholipid phosphatase
MKKLLLRIYSSKKASLTLKIISHASVLCSVAAFCVILICAYRAEPWDAAYTLLFAAIPFIIVTVVRKLINAPRPYELYDFYKVAPKEKRGESFPSRHVFSSFIIATLIVPHSIPLAAALFVIGFSLAASRVLLGLHFIRDVAAGALIGIISGVIGIIIM